MIGILKRTIFRGDVERGKALVGDAGRVMHILENMMRLRGLDQLVIRMSPYPGAMITCSKVFGARTTVIEVGGGSVKSDRAIAECVCNCNFTEGFVLEVQDEQLETDVQLYTVMACVGKRHYVRFKDVLASDFTLYEAGQKVLLIPYYEMSYLCCTGSSTATGCRPVVSDKERADKDWRTSHRIIPWCALRVPKWVKKRSGNNG